jgi:hypothetical protein
MLQSKTENNYQKETIMATTNKKTPSLPNRSPEKFNLIKPQTGQYVHFSDKLTGALNIINNVIEDNKGTLDSIQDMALELTRTVSVLRNVAIKYVQQVDQMLEVIAPIVNKMPIFPEKLKDFVNEALELSNKIIEASDIAQNVLPGVEKSLMTADIGSLQSSKAEVANLTRSLQSILPAD